MKFSLLAFAFGLSLATNPNYQELLSVPTNQMQGTVPINNNAQNQAVFQIVSIPLNAQNSNQQLLAQPQPFIFSNAPNSQALLSQTSLQQSSTLNNLNTQNIQLSQQQISPSFVSAPTLSQLQNSNQISALGTHIQNLKVQPNVLLQTFSVPQPQTQQYQIIQIPNIVSISQYQNPSQIIANSVPVAQPQTISTIPSLPIAVQPTKVDGDWWAYSTNLVKGKDNTIQGYYNKIQGQNNVLSGESNQISGQLNKIEGTNNRITGGTNLVSGRGNVVGSRGDAKISDEDFFGDFFDNNSFWSGASSKKKGTSSALKDIKWRI